MNRGTNVRNTTAVLTTTVLLIIASWAMRSGTVAMAAGTEAATTTDGNADKAGGGGDQNGASMKADLDAQLAAARAELERAAHEVAEISAKMAGPYMDDFMHLTTDRPSRAVIGVQLDTNSGNDGARIQEVSPGGPAADAGLHVGDVIVEVNGNDVKGNRAVREVLHQMSKVEPDSKVRLKVIRDGKPREFVVVARPGAGFYADARTPRPPRPPLPPGPPFEHFDSRGLDFGPVLIHGPLADLQLVSLTPQLGSYFGTDKGVLVVRAPKEQGFKLEDGDVILTIDGREPTSGSHATRILGSYQPGEKIVIKLMRQHKSMTIETSLPEGIGTGPRPEPDRKVRLMRKEPTPAA
jgi:membrane-associated protease RseP (regulator of RpoE activity)